MTVTAAAAGVPVPPGRGRWRLTVHKRVFDQSQHWNQTMVAELSDATARQLVQAWNTPAQLTFTLNGDSPEAAYVVELGTDVIAWRWDENSGADVAMFRGIVDHSQDSVDEQTATVTFTCHDYAAMLARRMLTYTWNMGGTDQDTIVENLVNTALFETTSNQLTSFSPGSYLPLFFTMVNPDGSNRAAVSGQVRAEVYTGNTLIGQAVDDLSKLAGGFDYDVKALGGTAGSDDAFRVWYPQQGVSRTDVVLLYGSTVSGFQRTVDSGAYANYQRVLGNNGSSDPAAAQLFAEAWNTDANNVTVNPVGLWMATDNAADVAVQQALNDRAGGDLNLSGILIPTYTVTLRPGFYSYGHPNMGDTVPLILLVGRLNVNTTQRIMGITYTVGDDGAEDVALVLGRPATTLLSMFTQADRDVDALTRR